ncbi:MAG: histidine phosphatase family protein [Methylophaga sp.]|nr:histidine phosphatase family protein [Methylophaga sp.]
MSFTLYLMRHAKSDWSGSGSSDFERPINERGKRSALIIGQWLLDNEHIPQHIVSSSAVRAKQTTELATSIISPEIISYEKELYLASVETLLHLIQTYKTGLNSLMVVAHNPGLEELVEYLIVKSEQSGSGITSMTTANMAIFEYSDNQFDIKNDKGRLIEFIRPSVAVENKAN